MANTGHSRATNSIAAVYFEGKSKANHYLPPFSFPLLICLASLIACLYSMPPPLGSDLTWDRQPLAHRHSCELAARVYLLGATAAMLLWTPPGPGRGAGKNSRRCIVSCKGQRQKQSFSLHPFVLFFCFSSIISTAYLDVNTQAHINLAKLFGIFIYNAKACAARRAKNIKKYSILWCT